MPKLSIKSPSKAEQEARNTYHRPYIQKEDTQAPSRFIKRGLERRKRSPRGEPYICKD